MNETTPNKTVVTIKECLHHHTILYFSQLYTNTKTWKNIVR